MSQAHLHSLQSPGRSCPAGFLQFMCCHGVRCAAVGTSVHDQAGFIPHRGDVDVDQHGRLAQSTTPMRFVAFAHSEPSFLSAALSDDLTTMDSKKTVILHAAATDVAVCGLLP